MQFKTITTNGKTSYILDGKRVTRQAYENAESACDSFDTFQTVCTPNSVIHFKRGRV